MTKPIMFLLYLLGLQVMLTGVMTIVTVKEQLLFSLVLLTLILLISSFEYLFNFKK